MELIMMKERRDRAERGAYTSRCPIMLMNINAPLGVVAINAGHSGSPEFWPPFLLHAALPGGTTKIKGQSPRRRPVFLPFLLPSPLCPRPLYVVASNHTSSPPPPLSFFSSLCFSRGRDHEWHRAAARHKRIIKIK